MRIFEKIKFPYICERLISFSIPKNGFALVFSYEGIHKINLATFKIETDRDNCENYSIFDTQKNELFYENQKHSMLGLYGGSPILIDSQKNKIQLDSQNEIIRIHSLSGEELFNYSYEDLSGDWVFATYSEDFKFLILGLPYEFNVFKCL